MRIECTQGLLAELRGAALEAMHRFPHGGVEIGGVLFGSVRVGAIRVEAAQPVECSYSLGPSFTLDAAGEAQFRAAMDRCPGLAVVGWYHSHTRSGLELSGRDADLHRAHFKEPWQVALVIRPGVPGDEGRAVYRAVKNGFERAEMLELARTGTQSPVAPSPAAAKPVIPNPAAIAEPGSAAFARMAAVSKLAAAPQRSLPPLSTRPTTSYATAPRPLTSANQHSGASAAPAPKTPVAPLEAVPAAIVPANRPPLSVRPSAKPLETVVQPAPAVSAPAPVGLASASGGVPRPPKRTLPDHRPVPPVVWVSAGVAAIVLLAAAAAMALYPRPKHDTLALNAADDGGQLQITWDRQAAALQNAERGVLDINDGGRTLSIALGPERLRSGGIAYTRRSDDVEIRMTVEGPLPAHETVRVLGQTEPPAEPATAVAELPPVPPDVQRLARPQQLLAAANRPFDTAAPRRPEPPPLRWRPFAGVPQVKRTPAVLPEPPRVASVLPQAASMVAPSARLPAAPPAVAPPAPRPSYAGPRTGRILWIGRLDRGMQVSISGGRASAGVLKGELPGVPVRVTVRPAKINRGRLTVYTDTRAESRAPVEKPSAETGWYPTGYEWSAKRRGDVALASGPSVENGWTGLSFRGAGGVVPVVVIYWRVLDDN